MKKLLLILPVILSLQACTGMEENLERGMDLHKTLMLHGEIVTSSDVSGVLKTTVKYNGRLYSCHGRLCSPM